MVNLAFTYNKTKIIYSATHTIGQPLNIKIDKKSKMFVE